VKNQHVTAIVLQNDQADWYMRYSDRFVSALVSRMNVGETDKYPGYARWHGDGIPGCQVVWAGNSNINGIISVGQGHGVRLGVTHCKNAATNKLAMLKELAEDLGYSLHKKPGTKQKSTAKTSAMSRANARHRSRKMPARHVEK